MDSSHKIAVVGLWHLGEIYSVCLAALGHTVVGIDADAGVVENFLRNVPPLAEPKLAELLATNRAAGRLSYTTDFSAVRDCDVVWITFDTPVNDDDEADVEPVLAAIKKITPDLRDGVVLVVSSQIPVGTSAKIIASIVAARPSLAFDYVYSPENLRLGVAVDSFMQPGRIVAGANSESALARFKTIFADVEMVSMNPASAEMAKHALNAWLATSISFTNDIADLCEQYGADVEAVARALKSDPRVGPKAYLFAGLGFSGGTLGRDLKAMMKAASAAADGHGVKLPVIESVFLKNKSRNAIVRDRLEKAMGGKEAGGIKGKIFAMFGMTYKVGTSTLRRSQPLEIERALREAGAQMRLYDPWAKADEVAAFTPSSFFNDPYVAAEGADAILVMTPWKGFGDLDFGKLGVAAGAAAARAAILFDTCNILCDKEEVIWEAGFNYLSIGR